MADPTFATIKRDCRHFRGDVPCLPHKQFEVHCIDRGGRDCVHYDQVIRRVLIIKLGAIGDVIRTTPLLHKLRAAEPRSEIWWLTQTPEILPKSIDVTLPFAPRSLAALQAVTFDVLYNLDKDREACALASQLSSPVKKGFLLENGKCAPADAAAEHKDLTGVFDDLSRANTKSYQQEIFEICGFTFAGERYLMPGIQPHHWKIPRSTDRRGRRNRRVVGLNTGCGGRWTSRLWPEAYWISLAKRLIKDGHIPLLLGGEQEHAKNRRLARASGAIYLGHYPLERFMSEVDQCDLVVTAVTMAMHLAIGLGKKIVLFNNIFNKHEFELYGQGEILEPEFACTCFYSPTCVNNCMQYLTVDRVHAACTRLLGEV